MLKIVTRRCALPVAVLVLLGGLAAPADATGPGSRLSSYLWAWLSSWTGLPLGEYGPGIDPDGSVQTSTARKDYWPVIDPDGRMGYAAGAADYGPMIDPDGRNGSTPPPQEAPSADYGPVIDPNGGNR